MMISYQELVRTFPKTDAINGIPSHIHTQFNYNLNRKGQPMRSISLISLSLYAILSSIAHAEEILDNPGSAPGHLSQPPANDKDWIFTTGAGAIYGPAYEGSDKFVVTPLPDVSVEYKNGLFFANIWDGIGSYPLQGENYKVGASIGWMPGRDENDDKKNLRGMGDIDMEAILNLMGEYDIGHIKISGKVSTGTENYGTTATVEVGTMFPVTGQLMIMGAIGPTWADADHMNSYFGISTVQSARSGYKSYNPTAGIKSVGLTAGAFYSITEYWDVKFMIKADQLLGDAADSPITKQDFQPSVFLTTSYIF